MKNSFQWYDCTFVAQFFYKNINKYRVPSHGTVSVSISGEQFPAWIELKTIYALSGRLCACKELKITPTVAVFNFCDFLKLP